MEKLKAYLKKVHDFWHKPKPRYKLTPNAYGGWELGVWNSQWGLWEFEGTFKTEEEANQAIENLKRPERYL